MYTDWFKLRKLPFRLRPDPEFLYLGDETRTVYESLRAAVTGAQRLVLLLGEAGVGKTTLLHALARDWQGSAILARVQQPKLTSQELAVSLAEQFRLPAQDVTTHDLRARLSQFVAAESGRGHAVVILVDEAHRCSSAVLTELLNLAAWPAAPLIIMAGDDQLSQSLSALQASDTAPLTPAALRLARLSQAQIGDYLKHRLEIAGSEGRELFEPDAIGEIVRYTGGTPQLINTLCDTAMMIAQAHSVTRVGIIEIRDAARELNWIEFSARKPLTPALADEDSPGRPAVTPRVPTLALEVRHDAQFVGLVTLVPGCLVVGRGTGAGLHLDSRFVSRRHCQFVTTPEQTLVEDLGSANGIRVNDQRCSAQRVVAGDTITLGDYTLTCIETTPAPIV